MSKVLLDKCKVWPPGQCPGMQDSTALHIEIVSEGYLTNEEIYDSCYAPALGHGFDPDGSANIVGPFQYGLKTFRYSVAIYERSQP